MRMRNVHGYYVLARAQRSLTRTNHGARMRARRIRQARAAYGTVRRCAIVEKS